MTRLVRAPDGSVRPDPTGRSNGRGAYLCRQAPCWEKGLVRRALERSFRGPVASDDLEALKLYFIETIASGGASVGSGAASLSARGGER